MALQEATIVYESVSDVNMRQRWLEKIRKKRREASVLFILYRSFSCFSKLRKDTAAGDGQAFKGMLLCFLAQRLA